MAPPERRGELAGDLDSIAGKALEKAPADRYASVAELAADVTAHLEHLPVKARRPSFGYLGRKFVRRHRAGASVAAAIVALLAAGVATVWWQARVAERERARAQQRFEQVRQLANYVIFDLQDGIARLAGSTALRGQMVERSLDYLDSLAAEAAEDPRLQTELAGAYFRLGDVQGKLSGANLGDREGALKSYGKARALLDRVIARDPRDADARRSLGRLLLNVQTVLGFEKRELGAKLAEESMSIWQGLGREDPTDEANMRGLASAHFAAFSQANWAERSDAATHMERALEIFQRLLAAKPDDPDRKRNVALCHKYLSGHLNLRDPSRSFRHAVEAARLDSERVAADPHDAQAKMDYTFDLGTLADLHVNRGEHDEALGYFRRALTLRRELWHADKANVHARDRYAFALMRLAESHVVAGRPQPAGPLLHECLEVVRGLPQQDLSARLTLSKAHLFLGEVALASKTDPCASYRRMAALLPDLPPAMAADHFVGKTARLRDRALVRLKACPADAGT
jgi:tetratricopeptide (TPR) repeat protein